MPLTPNQKDIIVTHTSTLLNARQYPKTICPSEVARALSPSELQSLDAATWRDTMDDIRDVVWEMWNRGEVEVLQKGVALGPRGELRWEDVRGPIRVRNMQNQAEDTG